MAPCSDCPGSGGAPVMGSFRGAAAEAKLRAHIEISSSR